MINAATQAARAGRDAPRQSLRRPPAKIVVRPDRPSSIVAPNRNITKKESGDGAAGDLTTSASSGTATSISALRTTFVVVSIPHQNGNVASTKKYLPAILSSYVAVQDALSVWAFQVW